MTECKEGEHIWVNAFPDKEVDATDIRTWLYCIKCYKRKLAIHHFYKKD